MAKRPLVQRLRENPNFVPWLDIAEAADRIEELEAEVAQLKERNAWDLSQAGRIHDELRRDIEDLEGALKIIRDCDHGSDCQCKAIAIDAIEHEFVLLHLGLHRKGE